MIQLSVCCGTTVLGRRHDSVQCLIGWRLRLSLVVKACWVSGSPFWNPAGAQRGDLQQGHTEYERMGLFDDQ